MKKRSAFLISLNSYYLAVHTIAKQLGFIQYTYISKIFLAEYE